MSCKNSKNRFKFYTQKGVYLCCVFSVSSEAAVFGFKSRGGTIHPIQGGSHEKEPKTGNRALPQRAGRQGAGRLAAAGRLVAAGGGQDDRQQQSFCDRARHCQLRRRRRRAQHHRRRERKRDRRGPFRHRQSRRCRRFGRPRAVLAQAGRHSAADGIGYGHPERRIESLRGRRRRAGGP